MPRARVRSLVEELRSHMLCGAAKKQKQAWGALACCSFMSRVLAPSFLPLCTGIWLLILFHAAHFLPKSQESRLSP